VSRWLRQAALAVRGWPIHRYVALALLAGIALPRGVIKVSFGDIWSAGPAAAYLLVAGVQILLLWWIGRRPVLGLAVTSLAFLTAQAFAWPCACRLFHPPCSGGVRLAHGWPDRDRCR
jgi:hypothetical protein